MQGRAHWLGIVITVASIGCNNSGSSSPPSAASASQLPAPPKPQAFQNPNRVVLAPAKPGDWAITLPDAADVDSQLAAYVQTSRDPSVAPKLSTPFYYGQYYGVLNPNGERVIHANFFCQHYVDDLRNFAKMEPRVDLDEWKTERVQVNDGGHCYFDVDYNPKTRKFEELMFNGDG